MEGYRGRLLVKLALQKNLERERKQHLEDTMKWLENCETTVDQNSRVFFKGDKAENIDYGSSSTKNHSHQKSLDSAAEIDFVEESVSQTSTVASTVWQYTSKHCESHTLFTPHLNKKAPAAVYTDNKANVNLEAIDNSEFVEDSVSEYSEVASAVWRHTSKQCRSLFTTHLNKKNASSAVHTDDNGYLAAFSEFLLGTGASDKANVNREGIDNSTTQIDYVENSVCQMSTVASTVRQYTSKLCENQNLSIPHLNKKSASSAVLSCLHEKGDQVTFSEFLLGRDASVKANVNLENIDNSTAHIDYAEESVCQMSTVASTVRQYTSKQCENQNLSIPHLNKKSASSAVLSCLHEKGDQATFSEFLLGRDASVKANVNLENIDNSTAHKDYVEDSVCQMSTVASTVRQHTSKQCESQNLSIPHLNKKSTSLAVFRDRRKRAVKDNVTGGRCQLHLSQKRQKKEGCKETYDKVNYCTFCSKPIRSKISRHLLTVHKDQPTVFEILLLPKRSPARISRLNLLANEGNFKHNAKALREGKGDIVVAYRNPSSSVIHNPDDYLPCEKCRKFVLKSTLWLHQKKCNQSHFESDKDSNDCRPYGYAVSKGRDLLNTVILGEGDGGVYDLLQRMNDDIVKNVVISDALIKRYAALRMESLGTKEEQKLNDVHRVSQGARTLARLVLECRKVQAIENLDNLIQPKHFDLIVSVTQKLAFNSDKPAPSLGKLVGNILGHVTSIKIGNALRRNDKDAQDNATNFSKLLETEWNYRVNSVGVKLQNKFKRLKVSAIPLTEDLKILRSFILSEMKDTANRLEKLKLKDDWTWLAKLTMSRLILFNKRRRAEVKDLKVLDYLQRPKWHDDENGEMRLALTETDTMLAQRMDMVIAAGKSRKNVDAYVILPPDAQHAIDLLNDTRDLVGVPSSNPYIFARMSSDTPLSGNTELREVVSACKNLQQPAYITSTSLRKYIATVSQVLDMTENELEMLARHLGHDPKTHKDYYRLSHHTIELSKVSQLLIAVDSGNVSKWKGKKLADISVNDLPGLELIESGDSEEEDMTELNKNCDGDGKENIESFSHDNFCESKESDDSDDEPLSKSSEDIQNVLREGCAVNVPGKRTPWSKSDLKILENTFHRRTCPPSYHDIRCLQAKYPSLKSRTLAQIKSRAWALMKH